MEGLLESKIDPKQNQANPGDPGAALAGEPSGVPGESAGEMQSAEVSPQAKPYLDRAVELLYGENFDNLVKMFKGGGEQGFPQAMSMAINGVLQRLEKDSGKLPDEVIAEVGTKLVEMLLQDLIEGGIIKNVTQEMLMSAIEKTIVAWGKKNPDRVNPQELAQAGKQADASMGQAPMGGA